jgi:hypothetical protein
MIGIIVNIFGLFAISIVVHEITHVIYLKEKVKKDVDLRFYYNSWRDFGLEAGKLEDYESLSDKDYFWVNMSAVWIGMIPIVLVGISSQLYLMLLVPYLFGVKQDIMEAVSCLKKVRIEWV